MKNFTLLLLFFTATFYSMAQVPTTQNEDCSEQLVSEEKARQIIENVAFSVMQSYLEKTLQQGPQLPQNNPKDIMELPANCFAPDTDPAVVEAFYQNRGAYQNSLDPSTAGNSRFNLGPRWSSTATDGGGLVQGDATTLTWSYVADGTPIGNGGCNRPDQGTFSSDFISFFNSIYGPPTTPGDFTTAPWHTVFVNMFSSWSNTNGLNFVYEPNDDGVAVAVSSNVGIVGVRGDMRISGHRVDGNSNVLACNYFPENGDMIIDTDDNFFVNNPGVGTINVLTHEIGHGLGIAHVCPINQTKLMEPFVTLAFQGPQEDDVLATNRHYGDPDGDNNTSASATMLGSNALPASYSRLQRSIDDNGDVDYFSFNISQAALLDIVLSPTGTTYLSGPQNPNGSCSPGSPFSASNVSDLKLEILDTDGATVLATLAANGAAQSETIMDYSLPAAGTYFIKISQQGTLVDNVQMYDLDLDLEVSSGNPPPSAACVNFTAELDATGNVTVSPSDVDGGSNDADGPVTLSLSTTSFTCADIGDNEVTLTVTDNTGQMSSCTTTVTVEDNLLPNTLCRDITVQIDSSCSVTITPQDVDNGSNDNCNFTLSLSQSTFTCDDLGENNILLISTDEDGNVTTCPTIVTVQNSLGIEDITTGLSSVGFFPNPAKNLITINNPESILLEEAIIYDLAGRIVMKYDLKNTDVESEINISTLKRANYILTIKGVDGQINKILSKE